MPNKTPRRQNSRIAEVLGQVCAARGDAGVISAVLWPQRYYADRRQRGAHLAHTVQFTHAVLRASKRAIFPCPGPCCVGGAD